MVAIASSSPIWASPSAATISSADRSLPYIFARTSLAMELLIAPRSMSVMSPASLAGSRPSSVTETPRSFVVRSSSPMIQLLAALALPDASAAASK
ncbi:hypothetical protein D3C83_22470 [compost metagenome]